MKPVKILKNTFEAAERHNLQQMSAAVSYFTVFSAAPLLLLTATITGVFFGDAIMDSGLIAQVRQLLGVAAADLLLDVVNAYQIPQAGVISTLVSIILLLIGGSGAFLQLHRAMNRIWGVTRKKGLGIKEFALHRTAAFLLIIIFGLLFFSAIVLSTSIIAIHQTLILEYDIPAVLLPTLNTLIATVITFLFFVVVFKLVPDVSVRWRDVVPGAILTTVLFTAGKVLLGYYLSVSPSVSAYNTVSSIIVLLIWVYFSSLIMFIGAIFTAEYVLAQGRVVKPLPKSEFSSTKRRIIQFFINIFR